MQRTDEISEFASDSLAEGFGDGGGEESREKDGQRHESDVNLLQFQRLVDVKRQKHLGHVVDEPSQHVQRSHLSEIHGESKVIQVLK